MTPNEYGVSSTNAASAADRARTAWLAGEVPEADGDADGHSEPAEAPDPQPTTEDGHELEDATLIRVPRRADEAADGDADGEAEEDAAPED